MGLNRAKWTVNKTDNRPNWVHSHSHSKQISLEHKKHVYLTSKSKYQKRQRWRRRRRIKHFMYLCALFTKDYISQLTALNKLLIFTVESRNRNATKYEKKKLYSHYNDKSSILNVIYQKRLLLLLLHKEGKHKKWDTKETNTIVYHFVCPTFELKRHISPLTSEYSWAFVPFVDFHILSTLVFASFVYLFTK